MKSGPADYLAKQIRAISSGFDLLILLASPKISARLIVQGTLPPPPRANEYLETLIAALEDGTFGRSTTKGGSGATPTLRALQRLILEGDSKSVSPEVREGARLALEVLDYPRPECGWDAFEGPPERESS